ncbi:MAG: RidA family protein [Bacteroidales bacterium]|jgi:enamine deaminase RidA (YjgF/YER057c/UK114 family)|nr:RidA family protein [Bacteroidales bacterium]
MNLKRSDFIKIGGITAAGAVIAPVLSSSCSNGATNSGAAATAVAATACSNNIDVEQRIKDMGLVLPPAPKPVAKYKPTLVSGNLLYVSGQGPVQMDGSQTTGKVGSDLTLEEGKIAARQVGLTMLSVIKEYYGDLNKICRLVKTFGMVNCTFEFAGQPAVINGFSELMAEVFGEEHGVGVRSAVGTMLPGNIAVEIEAVFELK